MLGFELRTKMGMVNGPQRNCVLVRSSLSKITPRSAEL